MIKPRISKKPPSSSGKSIIDADLQLQCFQHLKGIESKVIGNTTPLGDFQSVIDCIREKHQFPKRVGTVMKSIFLESQSGSGEGVISALKSVEEADFPSEEIAEGILYMACNYRYQIMNSSLSLPVEFEQGINPENQKWLLNNYPQLWLHLLIPNGETLMGTQPLTYEDIYKRRLYLFTKKTGAPNEFVSNFVGLEKRNIKGSKILVVGDGLGADSAYLLKNGASVYSVDYSKTARQSQIDNPQIKNHLQDNSLQAFNDNKPPKNVFHLEQENTDMFAALKDLKAKIDSDFIKPFDFLYSHSVLHLMKHPNALQEFLSLAKQVLKPGGKIAFTLRAIGNINDGNGLVLQSQAFRVEHKRIGGINDGAASDVKQLRMRYLLNVDGVSRSFGDRDYYDSVLQDVGLIHVSTVEKELEDYGFEGTKQRHFWLVYQVPE